MSGHPGVWIGQLPFVFVYARRAFVIIMAFSRSVFFFSFFFTHLAPSTAFRQWLVTASAPHSHPIPTIHRGVVHALPLFRAGAVLDGVRDKWKGAVEEDRKNDRTEYKNKYKIRYRDKKVKNKNKNKNKSGGGE